MLSDEDFPGSRDCARLRSRASWGPCTSSRPPPREPARQFSESLGRYGPSRGGDQPNGRPVVIGPPDSTWPGPTRTGSRRYVQTSAICPRWPSGIPASPFISLPSLIEARTGDASVKAGARSDSRPPQHPVGRTRSPTTVESSARGRYSNYTRLPSLAHPPRKVHPSKTAECRLGRVAQSTTPTLWPRSDGRRGRGLQAEAKILREILHPAPRVLVTTPQRRRRGNHPAHFTGQRELRVERA
jgi:hypothetical protein